MGGAAPKRTDRRGGDLSRSGNFSRKIVFPSATYQDSGPKTGLIPNCANGCGAQSQLEERHMAPYLTLRAPKGDFRSPISVRNFVVENVPCPVGHVPEEWTHAIYAKLRQYGVDSAVIMAGLKLARSDGYVFDDSTVPTSYYKRACLSHKHGRQDQ